ncbi:MAG: cyclic nucleotide-binding domain-containing protein [Bdellovibrionales bacterium]|nr:cyclic nucleotide-binding domain-containing protein [Bdellovibrionales bacterium]
MAAPAGPKVYKRGDVIYREGEKAGTLYLIQSGQVSLQLIRTKPIELFMLGANQVIGDHVLSGQATHPHSAVATAETKILELPIEAVKAQIEAGSQVIKMLTKSFADRTKLLHNELKSIRMERDSQACPPDQTAKIFGTVFHVANHKGVKEKDGSVRVSWLLMRQYAQRVFMESPKRMESAVSVFVKLGLAKFEMQKNEDDPEAPDEIGSVLFRDLSFVEWVFEHWQYYHFKGGKADFLKTDEKVMQVVGALVDYADGLEPDRNGFVRLEFASVVERFKEESGVQLNADYFGVIEQKGIFVKRSATDAGVQLQFEIKELIRWNRIWTVLKEVERWNEKGFVDLDEAAFDPRKFKKANAGGLQCPSCGHGYEGAPKFCSECGHKFTAAA